MFYVYILVSEVDGTLYTGQTQDIHARLKLHNSGRVQSTRKKSPWQLGYFEVFNRRSEAMWREQELKKKWNTQRKKRLVAQFNSMKIQGLLKSGQTSAQPSMSLRLVES
jgi:putative endonuclease